MDTKRHARFVEPGHAVTGVRTQGSRGAGWEFVHTLVDDCSRLAYSEVHDDERSQTVTEFTRRALDWFAELGILAERVLTDNAWVLVTPANSGLPSDVRRCRAESPTIPRWPKPDEAR